MSPALLLLSFRGRISRRWFWLGMIAVFFPILASFAGGMFSTQGGRTGEIVLMFTALGAAAYMSAAVTVKRLRDRGRSHWWLLIYGAAPAALYYVSLLLEQPTSNDPGFASIACTTAAMAIWLFALIDLGFRKGLAFAPS